MKEAVTERVRWIKRGSGVSCGTRHDPFPCDRNTKNSTSKRSAYARMMKAAAENAMSVGFLNGKRIKKKTEKVQ